jgi:hypothetical protein
MEPVRVGLLLPAAAITCCIQLGRHAQDGILKQIS